MRTFFEAPLPGVREKVCIPPPLRLPYLLRSSDRYPFLFPPALLLQSSKAPTATAAATTAPIPTAMTSLPAEDEDEDEVAFDLVGDGTL